MREPQHAYISSMEVDSDGYNSNKYDDKFSKLTPVPKKYQYLKPPPTSGEDINVQLDPNSPWDNSLMCPNTPTKPASSIQVWWLTGTICCLAPEHPKRCDKN